MTDEACSPYHTIISAPCSANGFTKQVLLNHSNWYRASFADLCLEFFREHKQVNKYVGLWFAFAYGRMRVSG
jgi:hypothetical protein